MPFTSQRIAIVGGGLGGMSLLNAATYSGLNNVELYERAPEFTEVGAGVNITRNANLVLDAYGLKESMLWKSSRDPPSYMEYRQYRTGEYLGQIDEFGAPRSRQIHRAHLLDVLRERVPEEKLHKGKELVSIEDKVDTKGYTLKFKDGTTTQADIVVGCDGIKSAVRQHMGIVQGDPIYSGQMVYRGYVAYEDLPAETAELLRKTVNFRGLKKHVLTLPIGNDESKTARVGIIAFITEPLEGWTSESWLGKTTVDDLAQHLEGWCPAVQHIVEGLRKGAEDGLILKQTLYVREPLDTWFHIDPRYPDSGIILLGDSAHSTLPHQGQGTCMAIESGFTLATILRNWASEDLASALQLYQDIRKPRTSKVTQTSYEAGKLASADLPETTSDNFNPTALKERMKWIMEYDVLDDVFKRGAPFFEKSESQANL